MATDCQTKKYSLRIKQGAEFARELGKTARMIRDELNLSLREFEDLSGVSRSTINSFEKGVHFPSWKVMDKICNALKISFLALNFKTVERFRSRLSPSERQMIEKLVELQTTVLREADHL